MILLDLCELVEMFVSAGLICIQRKWEKPTTITSQHIQSSLETQTSVQNCQSCFFFLNTKSTFTHFNDKTIYSKGLKHVCGGYENFKGNFNVI